MSRNGTMGKRYTAAFLARVFPRTGITLKMLENDTGISDATLARYRDDQTKIPADSIETVDAAFAKYGFPGFLAEVHPRPSALEPERSGKQEPSAERAVIVRCAGDAASVNQAAGGDCCWWATHEGTLHVASRGHGEFARAYVGFAPDTAADPRRFALDHMGWVASTRFSDGRIRIDGRADFAAPEAVERMARWLEQFGAEADVEGAILGAPMRGREAAAFLRALSPPPPPSPEWSSEQIDPATLADRDARRLWRQLHDDGIGRAHFLETADRLGVVDRCSVFLVDGSTVTSMHVGRDLKVDRRAVLGRDVMARADRRYAEVLRRDVLSAADAPKAMRMSRHAGGGYDRLIFSQPIGSNRLEVLTMSSGIDVPAGFRLLR